MGLLTRFARICRADINGVMDSMEDRALLLKEYVREMEEALNSKASDLEVKRGELAKNAISLEQYRNEAKKTDQDISSALSKSRDDIAKRLIMKLKHIEADIVELENYVSCLEIEIQELSNTLEEQKKVCEQIKLKARIANLREKTKGTGIEQSALRGEIPDEEVELELLKRKDELKEGAQTNGR